MYRVERRGDLLIFTCEQCGFRVVVKDKLEQYGRALIESHIKTVHHKQ